MVATGDRFDRLVVQSQKSGRGGEARWDCLCSCGTLTTVRQRHLTDGHTRSCGCLAQEALVARSTTHGLSHTPTWKIWRGMISRCYETGATSFPRYGLAGVSVCDRWRNSYANFLEDMGERPEGLTLERIGGAQVYSRETCTWATPREQALSRRTTRWFTHGGRTQCLKDWASDLGIPYLTLYKRVVVRGWAFERAITFNTKDTNANCE